MEEDYTKVPEERPSYSPIPPDKPPKKGGAAAAVIITAILILLIAGIGTAAYLLPKVDRGRNSWYTESYNILQKRQRYGLLQKGIAFCKKA